MSSERKTYVFKFSVRGTNAFTCRVDALRQVEAYDLVIMFLNKQFSEVLSKSSRMQVTEQAIDGEAMPGVVRWKYQSKSGTWGPRS